MAAHGLTDGQIALKANVPRQNARQWRIGERTIPEDRIDLLGSLGVELRAMLAQQEAA
jgi:hypothetical protein